jgi:predicted DCC family thiol-disulfide oxidoreductase YuxK
MDRAGERVIRMSRSSRSWLTVMEKHVLVYDSDCGNCTRFKRIVNRLDTYKKLEYFSLVKADEHGLLDPVPRSTRHRSFHLVYPGGRVISGSAAVPDLISLLPSGRAVSFLIRKAPGGRKVVNLIYSMFSRLHDSGSCSYWNGAGVQDDHEKSLPNERTRFAANPQERQSFAVWALQRGHGTHLIGGRWVPDLTGKNPLFLTKILANRVVGISASWGRG